MSIFSKKDTKKKKRITKTFSYYLHLLNFFVGIGFFLFVVWYGAFLYTHFYQAIVESEIIVVLRQQVAVSQINYPKFLQVLEKIKQKRAIPLLSPVGMNNPFTKQTLPTKVPLKAP